jgi:membrane-associated protease RseP (regulator of RpoE activity)
LPFSAKTLRGEEDAEGQKQHESPLAGFVWQRHPQLQYPVGMGEWQAYQPQSASPFAVWRVGAATFANPLGVEVAPADAALLAQMGVENGVVVVGVQPDSEAEKSGLRIHDVILKIGEAAMESPDAFNKAVTSEQGADAEFQVVRQGKRVTLPVAVPQARMYEWVADANMGPVRGLVRNRYRIGLVLAEVDATLRSQLRLDEGKGLVVTQVLPESPAAEADLREHDILIELDGKSLTTVGDLNAQVQEIKDRKVGVTLLRGGARMQVELAPQLESEEETARNDLRQPMQAWPQWYMFDSAKSSFRPAPLEWFRSTDSPVTQGNGQTGAADQIAALRKQLEAMQQSLQQLEAALNPAEESQSSEEAKQDE